MEKIMVLDCHVAVKFFPKPMEPHPLIIQIVDYLESKGCDVFMDASGDITINIDMSIK